jgi:diguanylate cyclase (GGDEF)-like protein
MNRSQMRLRSSRPSLMRARTDKPGQITVGGTKPGRTKPGRTKPGRTKIGRMKLGRTKPGQIKIGRMKLGTGKSRRPSTKTMIVVGGAACAVAAAGIAAMPITRRAFRRLTERRRQHMIGPMGLDGLTGLPNRDEAERMLGAALERGRARGRRVALLYVDVDDFKVCNDTYGAPAGDHVLQVTAARMQAQLRSGDTVCRLGGDDFVVIMESAGPDHMVTRVGERIADAIAQPITYEGETILVGASIGVAVAVNGEAEVDELIAHGDAAVDRARAAGRHVVQY